MRVDIRNIRHGAPHLGGQAVAPRDARELVLEGGQDVGAAAHGAEDDLPAAAVGDDEGAGLVVEGVAVGVGAHGLGRLAVQAGLADAGVVVASRAAVRVRVRRGARREARVEHGPLDVVVRVRIHAVAGFVGGEGLQIPRAPVADSSVGLLRFVRHRVGRVRVGEPSPSGIRQVARRRDARRIGQIRRDPARVVRRDIDNGQREVVSIHQRDVVERLRAGRAANEVELGERDGNIALEHPPC